MRSTARSKKIGVLNLGVRRASSGPRVTWRSFMPRAQRIVVTVCALVILVVGCTAPASPAPTSGGAAVPPRQSTGPKRLVTAITDDVIAIKRDITGQSPGGALELERLLNAGLVLVDPTGVVRPELAEAVPALENGNWVVFPDGRMETHYKLRPGRQWHDGTPFTAEDLVFTFNVWNDRGQSVLRNVQLDSVDRVEAPDPLTAVVYWKRPLIYADTMFALHLANPLPRHLLEESYTTDKASLGQARYWTEGFVGTGAFKLKELVRGSHLILQANENYVLGRPKLDELEVKIVEDPNTMLSYMLAGAIDFGPLERGLSLDLALEARDRWRDGKVEIAPASWILIFPQFIGTDPPIVGNLQFRKALMHGLDRQQLVDSLMHGFTSIAHSYVQAGDPEYPHVESAIIRYEYDPRRAAQMIEALGYSKAADGIYRDGAGQRLGFEIRTNAGQDLNEKTTLAVSNLWSQLGIDITTNIIPTQRARDREYIATNPAFHIRGQSRYLERLRFRHSQQTPLPANDFVGQNYSRYMNPEFDALIDRHYATIPFAERMEVARGVLTHVSDQLPFMGAFYDSDQLLVHNKVLNVVESEVLFATHAWNAHEWDVK
jgi:peptide/nickel transport system substrate-binding protein